MAETEGRVARRIIGSALVAGALIGVRPDPSHGEDSPPPPPPAAVPASTEVAELREQVRRLEARLGSMPDPAYVRGLEAKVRQMPDADEFRRLQETVRQLSGEVQTLRSNPPATGTSPDQAAGAEAVTDVENPVRGLSAYAPFTEPDPTASMPATGLPRRLRSVYGGAFQWASPDDELVLQYNNLTLVDGRVNLPGNQRYVANGIGFPMALNILSGRATRMVEGTLAFGDTFAEPGANTFKMVFAYITLRLDESFNLRIGKQRLPFSYEFYMTPFTGLMNLDWSVFYQNHVNFGAEGIDAFGTLFDKRMTYSVGLYDDRQVPAGPNLFDYNDLFADKAALGLVNLEPFLQSGIPWLERLNLSASFFAGQQRGDTLPLPEVAGLNTFGIPFLIYNGDVRQTGPLAYGSAGLAYFHGPLSFQAEWEGGFQDLAHAGSSGRTRVNAESYYIQAAWLLTGETVVRRGMLRPLRPFDVRPGHLGPGAWEIAARYNPYQLDRRVFTAGLADPNLWTDRVDAIDLTLNWYWNEYLKLSLNWKHAAFGTPVFARPGVYDRSADQLVFRALIYF